MNNAFTGYQVPTVKKGPTYYWQQVALDALEYIENPVRSQVFKWAKTQEGKLKAALDYMKSRDIRNFRYLAKIMTAKN